MFIVNRNQFLTLKKYLNQNQKRKNSGDCYKISKNQNSNFDKNQNFKNCRY